MENVLRTHTSACLVIFCFHPHQDDDVLSVTLTRFFNSLERMVEASLELLLSLLRTEEFSSHFPARPDY